MLKLKTAAISVALSAPMTLVIAAEAMARSSWG